jgi:hypothetical protein
MCVRGYTPFTHLFRRTLLSNILVKISLYTMFCAAQLGLSDGDIGDHALHRVTLGIALIDYIAG